MEAVPCFRADALKTVKSKGRKFIVPVVGACIGCCKRFAISKYLKYIHHRALHHPDVKEHHPYCPSCAKFFLKGKQPMPTR